MIAIVDQFDPDRQPDPDPPVFSHGWARGPNGWREVVFQHADYDIDLHGFLAGAYTVHVLGATRPDDHLFPFLVLVGTVKTESFLFMHAGQLAGFLCELRGAAGK